MSLWFYRRSKTGRREIIGVWNVLPFLLFVLPFLVLLVAAVVRSMLDAWGE